MQLRLNKYLIFLFFSVTFVHLMANAMEDSWDPSLYRESSHMQKRWAKEILESIDVQPPKTILDVGSGDGDITVKIAEQFPDASVFGLDLSEKMVNYANQQHFKQENLKFIIGDAIKLPFHDQFNIVTSFNTIHRLTEPSIAINGIFKSLKSGGIFIAAFPVNGSPIMSEAIEIVDSKEEWKKYFTVTDRKKYALSDKICQQWLIEAGFTVVKARTKWEDEIFESREKFRDLLRATFSHRASLPQEKEVKFFEEVVDEYLKKSPLDQKGRVHFYFNRIEIIAVKPLLHKFPSKL